MLIKSRRTKETIKHFETDELRRGKGKIPTDP